MVEQEGIRLYQGAKVTASKKTDGGAVTVSLESPNGPVTFETEALFWLSGAYPTCRGCSSND